MFAGGRSGREDLTYVSTDHGIGGLRYLLSYFPYLVVVVFDYKLSWWKRGYLTRLHGYKGLKSGELSAEYSVKRIPQQSVPG